MRADPSPVAPTVASQNVSAALSKATAMQVDTSALDAAAQKANETKAAMAGLNINVAPQVDSSGLDAAIATANQLKSLLASIPGAISAAAGAIPSGAGAAAGPGKDLRGSFSHATSGGF